MDQLIGAAIAGRRQRGSQAESADMNSDGAVNLLDVSPFLLALPDK